jgi:cytochrome c oxidase accessory protein FixG
MNYDETLLKPEGRVLATMEADGRRRWLYPKIAIGRFFRARQVFGWSLIAIFTVLPFIKFNGKPLILLDVVYRRFTLFGYTFLPTDTFLLALLLVSIILSVFFVTALLGRVWCGWGCPQTVYLEYVFRPLERLFTGKTGRGGQPKNVAAWRYAALYVVYFLICIHLANTGLSYFVGVDAVYQWTRQSPINHPGPFVMVMVVAVGMMLDFSYFREQTCLIACPYGRLQSVMFDRNTLIIGYDTARGEPRGKLTRPSTDVALKVVAPPQEKKTGDCIDCGLCAAVCPTGIDIRDGLQFECIGCAQCIDVCDDVMRKVERPVGLVRYASQASIAGGKTSLLRPRVVLYGMATVALLTLLITLILTKPATDVTLARNAGRPFVLRDDGTIENIVLVKIINRTLEDRSYTISVTNPATATAKTTNPTITLSATKMTTEPVHIHLPAAELAGGFRNITLTITDNTGQITTRPFQVMGPAPGSAQHEHHEKKDDDHDTDHR